MNISLRQLAHTLALARHRNFTQAAGELHISQPALTRSIKSLEGALGVSLFDRLSSGLELTPAGEVFLSGARRVLRETDLLEVNLTGFVGLASGLLAISTGPYPGDRLVPDAVAALSGQFPGIHCRVREVDWTEVAGDLLQRESDVAVADLSTVADDARFETEALITERMYFICRREHPLAGVSPVSLADVRRFPLVGNRLPPRIADFLRPGPAAEAGGAGLDPPKIDIATFSATKRVVLSSEGITMAPLINVEAELKAGSMTVLRTAEPTPRMNSGLVYLRDRSLSPAVERFAAELRRIKLDMDRRSADLAGEFDMA